MNLLIKYATRGRRSLYNQAIRNVEAMTAGTYQLVVSADNCDPCMQGLNINYDARTSKIGAINRDLDNVKFDWLVNFSDDMIFTAPGWDQRMLRKIRSIWGDSTDFFAHFNDGFVGHKLPTMSVIGWDYYQRDKYIYHPSYKSVSCDAEAMFVAMMRGRHHYFPEVYFNHIHPANLRFPSDQTYRDNDKFGSEDTANYFERMSRCFEVENPVMVPDEIRRAMKI
jgi:hypothetical protein